MKYDSNELAAYQIRSSGREVVAKDLQSMRVLQTAAGIPVSILYASPELQALLVAYATPINAQENTQWQIKSWVQEYTFHNNVNCQVEATFYFIKPRYHVPFVAGATVEGAIDRGYANMNKGAGSSTWARTVVGATPFIASAFTTAYKVYKTVKKVIRPGEEYHLTFRGPSYKTIHYARYRNVTTGAFLLEGEADKYRVMLTMLRGTPVNSNVVKTDVNTAEVALDWIMQEKVEVGFNMFQNFKQYFYTTDVGTMPATLAPITVVEATGAGVLVANA